MLKIVLIMNLLFVPSRRHFMQPTVPMVSALIFPCFASFGKSSIAFFSNSWFSSIVQGTDPGNLQEALVRGGSPYGKWCWAKQEGRNHGGRSRPQLNKCGFWGMNSGTHAYVASNLQFPQLCFFLSYFKKYIIIWDRFSQGSPGCHGTPLCKPGNQHGSDFEVILLCQPHEFWDTGRCLLAWLT